MKWVAVETVGDEGAAQVTREALQACDVPVELKRIGGNPYLGNRLEIEVRVPEDKLADAEDVLLRLEVEAEEAANAESQAPRNFDELESEEAHAEPPPRRLSPAMFAVAGVIACALWLLLKLFP